MLLLTLLVALTTFFEKLPRPVIGWLANGLARLFWLLPVAKREKARLASNVHRVFGLPPHTAFATMFARQVVRHQARCALETLKLVRHPADVLGPAARIDGFADLRGMIERAEVAGKGHIVVTAHLGCWELCAHYGQQAAARPFHVLAKPARHRAVTQWLEGLRKAMGTDVLWTDRKTLLRDMLGALRKGESVGFVMDQKPEGRVGPVVRFLGQETEFVSGPASMAIKTGCAIIAIFCVRESAFHYRILSSELAPAGHGLKDETAVTQLMAAEIERAIRLYPDQWTWNYKRWRDQPAGGTQPPNLASSAKAAAIAT